MNATKIRVGDALPRIRAVHPRANWQIEVVWNDSSDTKPVIVDLAPALFSYKIYRPLRDDRQLFETVHVSANGAAVAWGPDDAIDMSASTIEHLADEMMRPHDFAAFLKRHNLSYDAAAAQLGISRRLVAYYASERHVPRYIALACAYLDHRREAQTKRPIEELHSRRLPTVEAIEQLVTLISARSSGQMWQVQRTRVDHKPRVEPASLIDEHRDDSPYRAVRH